MKLKQYCSLLFILSIQNINAQNFDNKEYLKCLASVESKLKSGEAAQAIIESNAYINIINQSKGNESKANALYTKLVACYGSLTDLNSVDSVLIIQLGWMKQHGGSHLDWGKFYHNKAKILHFKGQAKLALTGMQLAICRKWLSVPRDYKTIIASYREAGKIADDFDHKRAKYFHNQSFHLASKLKNKDAALEYGLLSKYAHHLFIDGDYDLLEKLYKKSENYKYDNEFTYVRNTITTALSYSEYVLIPNNRLDEAKKYLYSAKELAKLHNQVEDIPILDISLANIEFSLGNYEKAAPLFIDAYGSHIDSKQGLNPFIEINIIYNIIESLIQSKNVKGAKEWLPKHLELRKKLGISSVVFDFEYQLLNTRISFLNEPTVIPITQLLNKLKAEGCDIEKPITEKTIIKFPILDNQLHTIRELMHAMPATADEIPWQKIIVDLCLRQIEVHDYRRSYQVNNKVSFSLSNKYLNAIQEGMLSGCDLFRKTKDKNMFLKVCQLSEKNRNNLLVSNLKLNIADSLELPLELRDQEKDLISNIRNVLSDNSQGGSVDKLDEKAERLKAYKIWINELAYTHPNYHHLKYQLQLFDFDKFHNNIGSDSICFISYTRVYDEIIVNWTTKTNYGIESIPADEQFDLALNTLKKSINDKRPIAEIVQPAYYLYKNLLSFIPSSARKLVISHDGQLNEIPFELLVTSNNSAQSWSKVPFLIKEKIISYSPGWTSTLFHDNKVNKYPIEYWGLCYDPGISNNEKLAAIPMACAEIKACAQLWNPKESRISENGDTKNLMLASKSARIVHIACHAIADPVNGNLSYLWLKDSTRNSGTKITVAELYKWNFKSNITMLSSCQSGSGAQQSGEGIIGLTRAFLFAGNKNIISNLWSVPDFQTKILVTDFMKNLKSGLPCDVAIRNSKLQYLDNQLDQYAHPYYWGAMILSSLESNSNKPIEQSKPFFFWFFISITLLVGTVLIIKYIKLK